MIYFLFLTFSISGSLKVSLYRQDRIVFYISSSFLFRAFSPFMFNVITFGFMTTILLFMFTFSLFLCYVSLFFVISLIPLEKEMATHSSTLAWKIPWTEEQVGYSPWGHKELDTTERLHFHLFHLVFSVWTCWLYILFHFLYSLPLNSMRPRGAYLPQVRNPRLTVLRMQSALQTVTAFTDSTNRNHILL